MASYLFKAGILIAESEGLGKESLLKASEKVAGDIAHFAEADIYESSLILHKAGVVVKKDEEDEEGNEIVTFHTYYKLAQS